MAEQGMKIFSGIFKRTYRSLKDEFQKLYRLNQVYLQDSKEFGSERGSNAFIFAKDYQGSGGEIRPSADPSIVSDAQRMAQAQAVLQLATTTPGINIYEAQKSYLKALKIQNIEQLLPDPKGPNAIQPKPNPKIQVEEMKIKDKQEERQVRMGEIMAKLQQDAELNKAKIMKLEADAIRAIADAGGVATGHEIAFLQTQIAAEKQHQNHLGEIMKLMKDVDQNEYMRQHPATTK
jgi:hypothetical protein